MGVKHRMLEGYMANAQINLMTNKKAQKVYIKKPTHVCEIMYKNKSHYKKIKHRSRVNIITLLK